MQYDVLGLSGHSWLRDFFTEFIEALPPITAVTGCSATSGCTASKASSAETAFHFRASAVRLGSAKLDSSLSRKQRIMFLCFSGEIKRKGFTACSMHTK
jgi:hypothetical protein